MSQLDVEVEALKARIRELEADTAVLARLRKWNAAPPSEIAQEWGLAIQLEEIRAENTRLAADATQCHARNDELVTERFELKRERDEARVQVAMLRVEAGVALSWLRDNPDISVARDHLARALAATAPKGSKP